MVKVTQFELVPLKWRNSNWEWIGESYGEYPKTAKSALRLAKRLCKRDNIAVRILINGYCGDDEELTIGECEVYPTGEVYALSYGYCSDSEITKLFKL